MQSRPRVRLPAFLALTLFAGLAGAARANPAHPPSLPGFTGLYGEYLTGRFAARNGHLDEASNQLLRSLSNDPDNVFLRQQVFLVCALDGRPEAARLAGGLPGSEIAQLLLANDDAGAGRWDQARQRFAELEPDALSRIIKPLATAWSQQGAGQTDQALATLRPLESGPTRNVYLLHAALIADLAGRTADAERLYSDASHAYDGLNLRLTQLMASWQMRHGQTGKADATISKLMQAAPELAVVRQGLEKGSHQPAVASATDGLAEVYLALAASLRQQDSSQLSMLMLRYALDLRPDFTSARLLMADIQEQSRHVAAALDTLKPVANTDSLIAVVRLRRAALVQQAGDTMAALHELDQLAHDLPGSPVPLMQKGDVLREAGRFADAVKAYDDALGRIPHAGAGEWSLFYARAIAYDGAHDWPRAQADLEHALRLSPDQPSVLNYLGFSWIEQGRNIPRARRMIEKAAEERPNEGAIVDSLGWAMLKQHQVKDAVETLERAVELEPEDPAINAHLGDAYQADGRMLDAIYQWQRALTFKPAPKDAAALQAKLKQAGPAAEHGGDASQPNTAAPAGVPVSPAH